MPNYKLGIEDISQATNISSSDIHAIIEGKKSVTSIIAYKLQPLFGKAADELLQFQNAYNFYQMRRRRPTAEERASDQLFPRLKS